MNVSTKMNDQGDPVITAKLLLESGLVTQHIEPVLLLTLSLLCSNPWPRKENGRENQYCGNLNQFPGFAIHHSLSSTAELHLRRVIGSEPISPPSEPILNIILSKAYNARSTLTGFRCRASSQVPEITIDCVNVV